jgi:1-acyl-sn-glycerol-3-phosphate acyltransferase
MRDISYPPIIVTAKVLFRALGLRFQLSGTEHVPRTGGALMAFNHVSYIDFVLGGFAAQPSRRLVRFMAKREVFDHSIGGPVMRSMHHISVDRGDGAASMDEALRYLEAGEVVGIFPEATISRSFEVKELKSGATRIAAQAGVPLIPVALWGTQRLMTKDHPRDFSRGKTIGIRVGEPMYPSGENPVEETAELHRRLTALVEDAIDAYPAGEQPPGSWWLPASRGGSAPTPERAAELDAEEKAARAARKARKQEGGSPDQDGDPAVG